MKNRMWPAGFQFVVFPAPAGKALLHPALLWLVLMASLTISCGQQADEGAQGEYQNINLIQDGYPSLEVYQKAEALYAAISSGEKAQA
ncbi:MAG: hypothetical protein KBH75_07905, partial [Saprospiraceae bacterium]|nr:hypothetical protein [Saprospiraceae bacterium]